LIPPEFKIRPFSLGEARSVGLTPRALRGKSWQRIGAELYRWTESPEDHLLTLSAWQRVLPPEAVFASASAAWLHGIDLDPTDPVEVVVPPSSGIRNRVGLKVRRSEIPPGELVSVRGLRATALPLTIATLCLQRPAVEALIAIDMAIHLSLTDAAALDQYAEGAKGRHGAPRLRSLVSLAAPAESPMETRLRWLLIQAGLPRPEVQTNLRVGASRFRADLCYPSARLILEFDGGNHRERLVEDNRRQNLLLNGEYRVLRFTAPDIYSRADVVVAQVRAALKGTSGAKRTFARR
jgi:very-short-patch-repair endonuclease